MLNDLFQQPQFAPLDLPMPAGGVELDLGCGTGSFLLALAQRYPDRLILGADQLRGRLRKVDRRLHRLGITNAQLYCITGWLLIGRYLPDRSLDRLHVLCPDPWPKARHAPRRLLGSEFLGRAATKLKPGGILHFATDNEAYFDFVHEAIRPLRQYTPAPEGRADIADLKTDFEEQWEALGLTVRHVCFRTVPGTMPEPYRP